MSLSTFLSFAFPPGPNENGAGQYRWRVMVWAKLVLLIAFALWAIGLAAPLGLDGFARASDLKSLEQVVRASATNAISVNIFTLRREQCVMEAGQLRVLLHEKILSAMREYESLSGKQYPLPACADLH